MFCKLNMVSFMLFGGGGGGVQESSLPARCFVRAIADFIYLESKVFSINTESGQCRI